MFTVLVIYSFTFNNINMLSIWVLDIINLSSCLTFLSSVYDIQVSQAPDDAVLKNYSLSMTSELTLSAFVKLPMNLIKSTPIFVITSPRFVHGRGILVTTTTHVFTIGCDLIELNIVTSTQKDETLKEIRLVLEQC